MTGRTVLTAKEVAQLYFGGKRSQWAILKDARKGALPYFKVGNRIWFEKNSLDAAFDAKIIYGNNCPQAKEITR